MAHSKSKKSKLARIRTNSFEPFFFFGIILYSELLLKLLTGSTLSVSRLFIVTLFSVCYGIILSALAELISAWRGKRALMCAILALIGILFSTEYFLNTSYQTYMTISSIVVGGGNVAAEFKGIVFTLIFRRFWTIALFLLPTLLYGLYGKNREAVNAITFVRVVIFILLSAAAFGGALLFVKTSVDAPRYKDEYTFDAACHSFGLLTGCRLELLYSEEEPEILFQSVEAEEEPEEEAPASEITAESDSDAEPITEETEEAPEAETTESKEPKTHNQIGLDFAQLAEEEDNSTIASLHAYVASLQPSRVNEYTGIFEGKNLIFITAESFSKEVIDPELTPTLYRMANKGIVFEDYYQPAWGGSTSTGEYANLIGLIPTDGVSSITDTIGHNMYFTLGNQLQRLGYFSAAYHDGTYQYYDRDETHCNLGYSSWMALGNGMEEGVEEVWPESDLEMIDFTFPQYIDKQPFSIYYMTVSGHGNYLPGNAMTKKNYDAVADLDYSDPVKYYLAANLELEAAMESLIAQLEAAGIADDTVIVLGTDHYPYGLEKSDTWGNDQDYLAELYGHEHKLNPDQDHSALIIWSGCLEKQKPIKVTAPVSSIDIVPTVSNLFGLDYDSRLLVGRDVFSSQQPLVIWPDYSWLTDKGYYSTSSGKFTPNEGAEITTAYVDRIKSIVANKFTFSRGVLNTDYYGVLFGEDDIE